jgi:hypothetical protein
VPYEPVQVLGEDEADNCASTCSITECIAAYLNERQIDDKPGFNAAIAVQVNRYATSGPYAYARYACGPPFSGMLEL